MSKRLAYLGPAGSNTELACLAYDSSAERLPFASIPEAAAAVDSDQADEAVVPIENSLAGSVPDTLDLLIHDSTLFIRQELVLPIKHFLVASDGTSPADIKVIYSHPQALAQCKEYLSEEFPRAERVAAMSTSSAVEEMLKQGRKAAAITTERASALYEVAVLAREIEDDPTNMTRFVVLASSDHPRTGVDKTAVCFSFDEDAAGILHSALGEFSERGINLTKIESRPTRRTLGRYVFLVDLEGHRNDLIVQEALKELEGQVSTFKVFGSYPRSSLPF